MLPVLRGPLPSAGLLLLPLPKTGGLEEASLLPSFWEGRKLLSFPPLPTVFELFSGCFWTLSFSGESAAEYALDSKFFHENLLEKLSPKNRKFRSSRGSETRRKLDSVVFCGSELFRGVFGLSFQPNLLLNMLRTVTFFMKICWKKLSPKNRKFRCSRGSETRRKLDSIKCFVGLDS